MARVRKIIRAPASGRNYYLVDANVLANKHIPPDIAPDKHERSRIVACNQWWEEIDAQLTSGYARVYVPDVCIAEAFKVLAKKWYEEKWFKNYQAYHWARKKLSDDIRMDSQSLKGSAREVLFHDISTNRDIVISVDRFFELFLRNKKKVQIADLLLVATAKYLMKFFDIPKDLLHIVTMDKPLREGIAKAGDLPNAYDPTLRSHRPEVVFMD